MAHRIVSADDEGVWRSTRQGDGIWRREVLAPPGMWPCANPVRDLVAVSVFQRARSDPRSSILLFGPNGHFAGTAYQSQAGVPPVIAPRIPHYAMWSPTGSVLSFVAPGADGLTLFLSDADSGMTADAVATGAPLFSAWDNAGTAIAIHAGQVLTLFRPEDRSSVPISERAVGFRTPVFLGGSVFYARAEPPGVVICSYDVETGAEREHGSFAGGVALARAAGGRLAVAVTSQPESGVFDRLWLVDVGAGESSAARVTKGPFVAAFWAPDGTKVAVVAPTQSGDGRYAVRFHDADGSFVAATEGFVPAEDYRTMLGFFDQYAYSHALWSPDGGAFLGLGRLVDDGTAASFAATHRDYVLCFRAERGVPVERAGTAEQAFFTSDA